MKSLRPWAEMLVVMAGAIGIFMTWWVLLVTWETADNLGKIWYYWLRSSYLGIPVLVFMNVLIWKEKKGKLIWASAFIGAPIFTSILWCIWWVYRQVPSVWDSIVRWLQTIPNLF